MSLWVGAWWTCMANVGTHRMLREGMFNKMLSWLWWLGLPCHIGTCEMQPLGQKVLEWFWHIQEEGMARLCFLLGVPLGSCVSVLHFKRTCMLMRRLFKLVEIWCLCGEQLGRRPCMQNVPAFWMLVEHSTRCHPKTWSLWMWWYLDEWNAGKGGRHWNYFDKYKWKLVCSQTL
jgi:hypothetical protein